jgi:Tol biopolymer transport system component
MRIRIVAIGMLLLLSATLSAVVQSGNDLYQQGLARETAGDIKGAIQVFERIIRDFSSNRALTAKSLLQLGRWSELLGQDQARGYYERLVREFENQPEQTELVAQAKTRLAALVRTPPPPSAPAGVTVQPVRGGLLAVSPDGTKAIVTDSSKGDNIAVYDFSKNQAQLLTDIDWAMGLIDFPVWSPDTRRVAYTFARYGSNDSELRVTTLDGRSNLAYRADGYGSVQPAGWTRDGTTLVVVVGRPDKTWTVGTIPATGGRFTPLRSLGWSYDSGDATPRLSPDGRFIAYLEGEKGLRDVHVVSLDGREAYRITDDPADDLAPIWSPDSRHLAFTSNRGGAVSLWTVEVKDGKPVGQPMKLKDGMQSTQSIDWTERGIFYSQETRTWDLYTLPMDLVEGRPAGLPRPIPYSRTGRNVSPVWSPKGDRLAFVSSTAAEPNRRYVVVMPADSGQAREFLIPTTNWEGSDFPYDLRWFGDGRGIGFFGTDPRGTGAVFRLLLETGEWDTIPLPEGFRLTRTEWNTDGSAFYVSSSSAMPGIVERAVNGGVERLVYRSPNSGSVQSLEFSPDRKWLAFWEVSFGDATERIVAVDVKTGEARTIIEAVNAGGPRILQLESWTPSGDLLIERFKSHGTPSEILLLPVNGGAPRSIAIPVISPSKPGETPVFTAKWSPDGRSIVLGRVSRNWETFVIENPLAAVRAPTTSR